VNGEFFSSLLRDLSPENIAVVSVVEKNQKLNGNCMKPDVTSRFRTVGVSMSISRRSHGFDIPKRLIVFLSILYPVMIYFGSRYLSPQILALVLALLVLGRRMTPFGVRISPWSVAGGLLLAVLAYWLNNVLLLKLYPVLVNGTLLVIFASSLRYPPTIAERVARFRTPDLPPLVSRM
jgi:hypothetical protein